MWLIEVGYPALDLVTLYVEDSWEGFFELHSGDKHPFDIRAVSHPEFLFPIELRAGETRRFYLRVETSGSMQIPLTLWTPLAYLEKGSKSDTLLGVIFGILLVMFFYNLLLWLIVRDICYLYYITYIGAFLAYQVAVNGLGLAVLWPNWPIINGAVPFFMSLAGVSGLLFAYEFLSVSKKSDWLDQLFTGMLIIGFIILPLSLLIDYGTAARLVIAQLLFTLPVLMFSAVYFWLAKGDRSARLFCVAFAVLLTGGIIHGLMLMGYLPSNALTKNAVSVGLAIEVTLLSLALAGRFKQLQQSLKQSQQTAKEQLAKVTGKLEKGYQLKDEFLLGTLHRLKTLLEGASLPVGNLSDDKNGSKHTTTTKKSIQEMHTILDSLSQVSEVYTSTASVLASPFNLKRQLDMLIEQYQEVCRGKGIALSSHVEETVPEILYGDAGKLFKALSYLLDNAVKFTDSGAIQVKVVAQESQQEKTHLNFTVSDTGTGVQVEQGNDIFQPFVKGKSLTTSTKKENLGLGLTLCRQLMHSLGGSVSYDPVYEGGASFELNLTCHIGLNPVSNDN